MNHVCIRGIHLLHDYGRRFDFSASVIVCFVSAAWPWSTKEDIVPKLITTEKSIEIVLGGDIFFELLYSLHYEIDLVNKLRAFHNLGRLPPL